MKIFFITFSLFFTFHIYGFAESISFFELEKTIQDVRSNIYQKVEDIYNFQNDSYIVDPEKL